MKRRVISVLLAAVLLVSLLPVFPSASATGPNAAQIEQRIRSTYSRALRGAGRTSFNGWCGTAVSWQMLYLGIDAYVRGRDGKHEYDMYAGMKVSTGGYRVTPYPASRYTLRSAINAITANGTQDAYNLMIGFESSSSEAGRIYGHALVVYAILDGRVYFTESFNISIAGQVWPEGSAVSCTIDEFCSYYEHWTVFDGIAYFGVKSYADLCTAYSANMYAMSPNQTTVYTEPGDPGIHEPGGVVTTAAEGQWVKVTGLFKTPQNKFWYRIQLDGRTGYVPAETLIAGANDFSDAMVSGLRMPRSIHVGAGFNVLGHVTTETSAIRNAQILVYTAQTGIEAPILNASVYADAQDINLNQSAFNNALTFRFLEAGTYQLAILATLENYTLRDGEPVAEQKTVLLWEEEFRVITDWGNYPAVTFNGTGGKPTLDLKIFAPGELLGTLPQAVREGYTFAGWTLDPEGNTPAAADMAVTADVTLYAQWTKNPSETTGWELRDGVWIYCAQGKPVKGWFTYNGLTFYQTVTGKPVSGWYQIQGYYRPFSAAGALLTGLRTIDGKTYYMDAEGLKTKGWVREENGREYFFDENYLRKTGWIYWEGNYCYLTKEGGRVRVECIVDGAHCSFDRDGNMLFTQQKDQNCYLVCDRQAAAKLENTERLLLA